jgi:hypothetical protein
LLLVGCTEQIRPRAVAKTVVVEKRTIVEVPSYVTECPPLGYYRRSKMLSRAAVPLGQLARDASPRNSVQAQGELARASLA